MLAMTPEDNSFFSQRKRRAASGGTQTRDVLRSRQMLYQLSHRSSSAGRAESLKFIQGKWRLSLINRVTQPQHVHVYVYVTVLYLHCKNFNVNLTKDYDLSLNTWH